MKKGKLIPVELADTLDGLPFVDGEERGMNAMCYALLFLGYSLWYALGARYVDDDVELSVYAVGKEEAAFGVVKESELEKLSVDTGIDGMEPVKVMLDEDFEPGVLEDVVLSWDE